MCILIQVKDRERDRHVETQRDGWALVPYCNSSLILSVVSI